MMLPQMQRGGRSVNPALLVDLRARFTFLIEAECFDQKRSCSGAARCLRHSSFVPEPGLSLLDERRHALLLIGDGELRMEDAALEADAFGERGFVGAVDG